MKDFTSKGISLENMVGETPGKEKGMTGKTSDHRCRGVKTLLETMIECFVREDGTLDRDKLEGFWREYVEK